MFLLSTVASPVPATSLSNYPTTALSPSSPKNTLNTTRANTDMKYERPVNNCAISAHAELSIASRLTTHDIVLYGASHGVAKYESGVQNVGQNGTHMTSVNSGQSGTQNGLHNGSQNHGSSMQQEALHV